MPLEKVRISHILKDQKERSIFKEIKNKSNVLIDAFELHTGLVKNPHGKVLYQDDIIIKKPWADIRAYGADKNNPDNIIAIQAAIADNSYILVPDETFITSKLIIPSNRTLMGLGYNSCIKLRGGVNDHLIENADPSGGDSGIQILNLRLDGNKANQTGAVNLDCIRFQKVIDSMVHGCWIHSPYDQTPGGYPDAHCIAVISACKDLILSHNWCYDSDGLGIYVGKSGTNYPMGIDILSNHCYDCASHGIDIWESYLVSAIGNKCWNNKRGIAFVCAKQFNIDLNHCWENTISGIEFIVDQDTNTFGYGNITGNLCLNNGLVATKGRGIRVHVQTGSTGLIKCVNVDENQCHDNQGTKTQEYGIVLNADIGSQLDYINVRGNQCFGNNTKGYVDASGGNVNGILRDNQFENNSRNLASAATLTLPEEFDFINITGTTNITSIVASRAERRVVLKFAGVLMLTDGNNLKLAGNFVTSADDCIPLVCDGTNWYEEGARSVN